jgi:hypothetical protein
MLADTDTIREFLTRLDHRVIVVARKPLADRPVELPDQYVLWPVQLIDPVDQIAWLANYYDAVYVNLNPLLSDWHHKSLPHGRTIKDVMIARRTRILLDIDAHGCELSQAADERDKAREWVQQRWGDFPIMETESGNGYGLIYACDFANDDESKRGVRALLTTLNKEFPLVDAKCSNAGRLTRAIGTFNRRDGERVQTRIINATQQSNQSGTPTEKPADSAA